MARQKRTARKQLYRGASTGAVLLAYHRYRAVDGHSFDCFLTEYFRVWNHAHERGMVTHYDGIRRLAAVAPSSWRGYVKEISGDFIHRRLPHYDLDGDLPRFINRLRQVYHDYDGPPFGPYLAPRECTVRPPPDWLYQQPLVVELPSATHLQSHPGRFDSEAGPSRPCPPEGPIASSVVPHYRSPVYGHRPVGYGVRLADRDADSSSSEHEIRDIPMVKPPAPAEPANAEDNDDNDEDDDDGDDEDDDEEDPEEDPAEEEDPEVDQDV